MKDYNILNTAKETAYILLKQAYDMGYKQGFNDGEELYMKKKEAKETEGYQKGLEDAWEVCRKISWDMARGNSLLVNELIKLFKTDDLDYIVKNYTASEAIAKIREYEGKQKQAGKNCDNCQYKDKLDAKCLFCDKEQNTEIKVGDEVIFAGTGHNKGFVTRIFNDHQRTYYRCVSSDGELSTENSNCPPKRTGRSFPEIEQVLEAMRGEE